MAAVIVKPCGLVDGPPGKAELVVGHDDVVAMHNPIVRSDVAAVIVQAVVTGASGLRFDLCAGGASGSPTSPAAVLKAAAWPWQRQR